MKKVWNIDEEESSVLCGREIVREYVEKVYPCSLEAVQFEKWKPKILI